MDILKQLANAGEQSETSFTGMLGIDWQMLIFQILSFLVMVWILNKFVYPWLMKSVDDRKTKIDSDIKSASDSAKKAQDAEKEIQEMLKKARSEANSIIAVAKNESSIMVKSAEEKSIKTADQIINNAHDQIEKDILNAKKSLRNEMLDLVVAATEKVVGKTISKNIDDQLIDESIKEMKV